MVWKGNLAIFESSDISETREAMPIKIGANACLINPYLYEFFEPIPVDKIDHGLLVHGLKGKFGHFWM